MRKIKKLLAFILTVVMVLSLGITAMAATSQGSITIVNATSGKDYSVSKIFDLDNSSTIKYTIATDSPWYSAVVAATDLFQIVDTSEDTVKEVYFKDGKTVVDIISWASDNVPSTDLTTTTASSDTVVFSSLAYGYYYISTTSGSVVTLDNLNAANIVVSDKNIGPSWDPRDPDHPDTTTGSPDQGTNLGKYVSTKSSSVATTADYGKTTTATNGDTQGFMINAFVPKYNGGYKVVTYTITDTLPAELSYVENTATATITGTGVATPISVDVTVDNDVITVTYTVEDIAGYPADAHISIKYDAVVNSESTYEIVNPANLSWTQVDPNPTDPTSPTATPYVPGSNEDPYDPTSSDYPGVTPPDDSKTTTYVYGFELMKTFKNSSDEDLEATFNLSVGTTTLKFEEITDGVYVVSDDTNASADITVKNNQTVTIFGLAEGSYALVETATADDYNRIETPIDVEITASNTTDGWLNNTVEVENLMGTLLPSTGGIGTRIFYITGAVIMLGAVVVLVSKKRSKTEK